MVKLMGYEIKKCFLKKSILLLLMAFTLVNLVSIYGTYRDDSNFDEFPRWKELYPAFYRQFKGEMTEEKISSLLSLYRPVEARVDDRTASTAMDDPDTYTGNIYSDYYFLNWNFVKPMEYLYTYQMQAREIARSARSNLLFYSAVGNDYEYRKNQIIAGLYENRSVREFEFTGLYHSFVHYDFSILLVLLLSLYALAGVFVSEKESGMEYLLLTTRQGGRRTTMAKLIASTVFVSVVSLWFILTDFFGFAAIYGTFDGGSLPVYALENFEQSAVGMPLAEYAVVSTAVKILGAVIAGLIFLFLSRFFRSALFPYVLGLLTIFALAWFFGRYSASSHLILKICNPFTLLQCRTVFRVTEFVNFFGIPVLTYQVTLLIGAVWCVLLMLAISVFAGKNAAGKSGGLSNGGRLGKGSGVPWNFLHLN